MHARDRAGHGVRARRGAVRLAIVEQLAVGSHNRTREVAQNSGHHFGYWGRIPMLSAHAVGQEVNVISRREGSEHRARTAAGSRACTHVILKLHRELAQWYDAEAQARVNGVRPACSGDPRREFGRADSNRPQTVLRRRATSRASPRIPNRYVARRSSPPRFAVPYAASVPSARMAVQMAVSQDVKNVSTTCL